MRRSRTTARAGSAEGLDNGKGHMAEVKASAAAESSDERLRQIAEGTTPTRSMSATVVSFKGGAQQYENVRVIRLKDKRITLLIMCDYMPLICELSDGAVEIVSEGSVHRFEHLSGYVCHRDNKFSFLVKEDNDV